MNRQRADQNDLGSAQDQIVSPSVSQMRRSPTEPRILLTPLEMEFFNRIGQFLPFGVAAKIPDERPFAHTRK